MSGLQQPFETLFFRNPQPMWIFRLKDLAFLAVNDAAVALYGYSREEFLRMTLFDIRPPSESSVLLQEIHALKPADYSPTRQYLHKKKDGSLLYVRLSAHGVEFNGERARLVSVLDITEEQRALHALRRETAFSEKILENMIDGVLVAEPGGGITYMNPALREQIGLPEGQIPENYLDYYGVFRDDGVTPLAGEELPIMRALRGETVSGVEIVVVPAATQERIHLLVNATPLFTEDGDVQNALAVTHNVTDLVRVRKALEERERSLAALMANIPGMVYQVDVTPPWRMRFVSSGCLELTGWTAEQLLAKGSEGFMGLVHPDDRDWLVKRWQELEATLRSGKRFQLSYRIVTAEGATRWVWEQGTAIRDEARSELSGIEGIVIDATERVAAQEALAYSEERYRTLFDNAVEGIFRTTVEGKVLLANPAAARTFGYADSSEITEMPDHNVLHAYVEPGEREAYLAELERKGFVRDKVHALRRRDGTRIWVKENARAIYDDDGRLREIEGTLEDITDKVEAERSLRQSEERFARATLGANDGIWDWNLQRDEIHFSGRWQEQLGLAPGTLAPVPEEWFSRVHPDDRAALDRAIKAHLEGQTDHFEIEHRVLHSDGNYRWMLARGYKSHSEQEHADYLSGSQTDITARKQAEAQLQHDAFHDALTALPNRALLLDRLSQAIKVHRRDKAKRFALLYLDLDRFKYINDSLGHATGDEALKEVARRWGHVIREYDTLARLGGDEFALLLENIDKLEDALAKAQRLVLELEAPVQVAGQAFSLGVSVGVVFPDAPYENADDCLRDADSAMYQAKAEGRHQVVVFETSMRNVAMKSFRVDVELREAIASDQLRLYYQPIVAMDECRICGYEALVRWFHPERGMIPPLEFIPFAEESGLIVRLDLWVLDAACRQIAEWRRAGVVDDDVSVSVNLSARQMGRAGLPEEIAAILARHRVASHALKVELTETALIGNIETAKNIMLQLKEMGVGVVLDDFGTGYSSLSYLYQFPFDGIKVDQSFVRQLDKTEHVGHLMELIQALGERMKVRVVPEGIEYEAELQRLRQMGFKHAQGYYFGRPMPPEEAIKIVYCLPANGKDNASG